MKLLPVSFYILGICVMSPVHAESLPYADLVKAAMGDATSKTVIGKTVQIAVTGKGELGYFAKTSDEITFVCGSGDKALTANSAAKGIVEGTVVKAQGLDGTTVFRLKDCKFVNGSAARSR